MADVDIGPFGEHESRSEEPMGETIPLIPGEKGVPTWDPGLEKETSFRGGLTQERRLTNSYVDNLYNELSKYYSRTSDVTHYDLFSHNGKCLYFIGKYGPLANEDGKLKTIEQIKTLGLKRVCELGFEVPMGGLTFRQVSEVEELLASMSNIDKADEIDLQEIAKSTEGLISQMSQTDDLFEHPLRKLLGLDKQLRSIGDLLKVEVAKKVKLEEHIKKEKQKLERIWEHPGEYDDGIQEDITNQIAKLNDELKARQESIDLLKGRLMNQIMSFKEMITKVLDKDTSLADKIRMLFREQGITIISILMAIGMAISVLVKALLPGDGGGGGGTIASPPPPKDEKSVKEWLRNKLKALASLLGRLGFESC